MSANAVSRSAVGRWSCAFLLPVLAAFAPTASAQDATPPQIVSGSISPSSIDVTTSAGSLPVTMHLTDDLAGVNYASVAYVSPSGSQTVYGTVNYPLNLISGNQFDGTYQSVIAFPRFAEAGAWQLVSQFNGQTYDQVGNVSYYTATQLTALGFPATIQVTSVQDVTPPNIVSGSISGSSVDVSSGPASLPLTMHLTDDLAGFNNAWVAYVSPSGSQTVYGNVNYPLNLTSGDQLDGVYQSTITFPQFSEAGAWQLVSQFNGQAYDHVGNLAYYTAAQLTAIGFPATLQVTSVQDVTPPIIVSGSIGGSSVDVTRHAASLPVSMHLTDDLSGVSSACAVYVSPSGNQSAWGCVNYPLNLTSGDRFDGTYEAAIEFPQFSETGAWHPLSQFNGRAYDQVGNGRFYGAAGMIALGFPDTINVNIVNELSALGPADVWLGLKNSDDIGTKFDLLAEVLRNGVVVGSGQVNSVPGGSSGFNNAKLRSIPLTLPAAVNFAPGTTLSLRLSVRISADSGHRSGTARLWFNDGQANSRFNATIGNNSSDEYLRDPFALGTVPGSGPKKTVDVLVDRARNGNPFKPFGTWSITF